MKRAINPKTQEAETRPKSTDSLLHAAILAVDALAEHLKNQHETQRMYLANKALRNLYGIQKNPT